MNGRRWRRRAEYATRSVAATHQHNEILANKTILTLNLKQVARSRRRGQQGRGKVEGHTQKPRRGSTTRTASNPKNTRLKFKIAFIILTFQWRTVLIVHSASPPLPSLRAFVKYLFFGLDRRIYLLACALQQDQVPLTNVRTKPDTSPGSMAARKGHSSKEIG